MKTRIALKIAAMAILLAFCSCALAAAPKAQVENENVDFGKVAQGAPIGVEFRITNAGDADLEITGVQPGCGCTKAEAAEKKLAPGKSTTINAVFNSGGAHGKVSKSITVTTNDPTRQSIMLHLSGEVVVPATFDPPRINFGTMKISTSRTRSIFAIPGDEKTFAITGVKSTDSHLKVAGFKRLADVKGVRWQVDVTITAGAESGRIYENCVLTTDSPGADIQFLVYGNVEK